MGKKYTTQFLSVTAILLFVGCAGYFAVDNTYTPEELDTANARAGNIAWAGYTTNSYTGDVDGVEGGSAKCEADYVGSHWATVDEIIAIGNDYPWSSSAWMSNIADATVDCDHWRSGSLSNDGIYTTRGSAEDTFLLGSCGASRKLACVYGFDKRDF